MIRKVLYILGGLLLLIVVTGAVLYFTQNEPLPEGKEGPEAEALADRMLEAMNYDAYQKISRLQWTFRDKHHFDWRKNAGTVQVRWDDITVDLKISDKSGTVTQAGNEVTGEKKTELLEKAYAHFANDSFWLLAPFKVRDGGTTRKLVKTEDRGDALLITYQSGGVTPGDSYLWILGEDGKPVAYKMWVQIIPVGGMEFSWTGWTQMKGAWFAPLHSSAAADVNITNLKVD